MDLLQLKYFQTVANMEHLSNAAKKLCIAQPALTQTIHRLESELGIQLFDRKGRNIYLNTAGKIFLQYTNQVFNSLEDAKAELRDLADQEEKSVSLSIHAASLHLPALLNRIRTAYPDIHIEVSMQNKDYDFSIYSTYLKLTDADHTLLLEEELMLALPKDHPLALQDKILAKDLSHVSFISLSEGSSLYQTVQFYLSQKDLVLKNEILIDNPTIMRQLLLQNNYGAFIPSITWYDFSDGALVYRPVEGLSMKRFLYLSQRPNRYLSPYARQCKSIITDYFHSIN